MTEEKMFDKETKQTIKENDELIECEKGEMKFRGLFQKFIETFEAKYSINSMLEKEIETYKLKRVILIFQSNKGKSKRVIIQESEDGRNNRNKLE
jgi:hypothetical protein